VDIVQWKEDCAIPRQEFLKLAKGADGILCLLTDKIDAELLDAAGITVNFKRKITLARRRVL
jgi:glyoxylate/hydroxypyruvate reductase